MERIVRKRKVVRNQNISKEMFDNVIDDIKVLYNGKNNNISLQDVKYWNKRFIDKNKLRNTQCEECFKNLLECGCSCHWW